MGLNNTVILEAENTSQIYTDLFHFVVIDPKANLYTDAYNKFSKIETGYKLKGFLKSEIIQKAFRYIDY